jgi:hypothetical protein
MSHDPLFFAALKGAGMPALQVRDFPAELYEELKARAQCENRSLSQQAIVAIREHLFMPQDPTPKLFAREEDGEQRLARRRALFEEMDQSPRVSLLPDFPCPAEIIREIREGR